MIAVLLRLLFFNSKTSKPDRGDVFFHLRPADCHPSAALAESSSAPCREEECAAHNVLKRVTWWREWSPVSTPGDPLVQLSGRGAKHGTSDTARVGDANSGGKWLAHVRAVSAAVNPGGQGPVQGRPLSPADAVAAAISAGGPSMAMAPSRRFAEQSRTASRRSRRTCSSCARQSRGSQAIQLPRA